MFITKPFEEKQIISALEKFLNLKFLFEEKNEKEEFRLDKNISQKIKQAATQLDAQTILNILNEEKTNSYTTEHIKQLLREYRFDEIENLCSKTL
jgi:response regulator of citrate/malate metabolism